MSTDSMQAVHAAIDRGQEAASRTVRYIPQGVYRHQKAALTRAKNSGDPRKVVDTVVATVREWNREGYAWPDAWSSWNVALQDAVTELEGWSAGMSVHVDNIR